MPGFRIDRDTARAMLLYAFANDILEKIQVEPLKIFLEKQIQGSHIFTTASSGNLKKIPDFQVSSNVYKLEVEDINNQFRVCLQMQLELIDYFNGKSVLDHKFDRSKALGNRDLNLFASELSSILQEEASYFISKIRSYLKNRNIEKSVEN